MITHHPMAQHRKPSSIRRRLTLAGECLLAGLALSGLLLAVGAIGR